MRVIAGDLGGRLFESPRGHRTHPMSEKIRGALFNTLGDVRRLTILDTFSGSGAVAIEAVSRGSGEVIAVELDRAAFNTIVDNVTNLGIQDKVHVVRANIAGWIRTNRDKHYDIVIADPPYDKVQIETVEALCYRAKIGGTVVLSLPPKTRLIMSDFFELMSKKNYGDATLVFYRRIK